MRWWPNKSWHVSKASNPKHAHHPTFYLANSFLTCVGHGGSPGKHSNTTPVFTIHQLPALLATKSKQQPLSAASGVSRISTHSKESHIKHTPKKNGLLRNLIPLCQAFTEKMEPLEVEFFAENEEVTIIPNFSEHKLCLISVSNLINSLGQ